MKNINFEKLTANFASLTTSLRKEFTSSEGWQEKYSTIIKSLDIARSIRRKEKFMSLDQPVRCKVISSITFDLKKLSTVSDKLKRYEIWKKCLFDIATQIGGYDPNHRDIFRIDEQLLDFYGIAQEEADPQQIVIEYTRLPERSKNVHIRLEGENDWCETTGNAFDFLRLSARKAPAKPTVDELQNSIGTINKDTVKDIVRKRFPESIQMLFSSYTLPPHPAHLRFINANVRLKYMRNSSS